MSNSDQNDLENDPLWDLVDGAKSPQASPLFVRNVMREVRLSEEPPIRWWQQLLTPKPILAGSLAALAAAILISVNSGQSENPTAGQTPPVAPLVEESRPQLDTLLEAEMLSQAAEDPSAFSDEALVTLLY